MWILLVLVLVMHRRRDEGGNEWVWWQCILYKCSAKLVDPGMGLGRVTSVLQVRSAVLRVVV